MSLERNLAKFIKTKGIQLSVMSRATGIPYMALYDTFYNGKKSRQIKGKELVAVSEFLGINPADFIDKDQPDEKGA